MKGRARYRQCLSCGRYLHPRPHWWAMAARCFGSVVALAMMAVMGAIVVLYLVGP